MQHTYILVTVFLKEKMKPSREVEYLPNSLGIPCITVDPSIWTSIGCATIRCVGRISLCTWSIPSNNCDGEYYTPIHYKNPWTFCLYESIAPIHLFYLNVFFSCFFFRFWLESNRVPRSYVRIDQPTHEGFASLAGSGWHSLNLPKLKQVGRICVIIHNREDQLRNF